ncbi:hypothetical protein RB600_003915 [Gaeumannomyces tritici]
MSDSEVEEISNPSRPRAHATPNARNARDDELVHIELATSSSPPARRQRSPPVTIEDDDDDDEDDNDDEEEQSLFVSQNPSPVPERAAPERAAPERAAPERAFPDRERLREAGRSLLRMDGNDRGRRIMERRRQEFIRREREFEQRQQQPANDFIDLTAEPHSPDYSRLVFPPMHLPRNDQPRNAGFLDQVPAQNARAASRNPRRQAGLTRTPSLARSDASINGGRGRGGGGGNIPMIDLTDDGPEPVAAPQPQPAQLHAAANHPNNPLNWDAFPHLHRPGPRADAQIPLAHAFGIGQHIRGHLHQLTAAMLGNANRQAGVAAADPQADQPNLRDVLGLIHLDLDYGGGIPPEFWEPHPRQEPQKPVYVPPKEAMEGCTRSTGEDVFVICPSCKEELVYDPDEKSDTPPPAKRQRTKKDRAEHHFMAVKACGHVFCHKCYADRKQKSKDNKLSESDSGFRPGPNSKTSVMCAVEGCNSEVGSKTAWLGIFI